MLGRGQVRLIDVAGLDESTPPGDDAPAEIERRMAEQARRAAETADFLIAVIECGDDRPAIELPRRADLVVRTKSDLHRNCGASDAIVVSAVSDASVDQLRQRLDRLAFGESSAVSSTLALNSRHLVAIAQAREALRRVTPAVQSQPAAEVVALELRDALDALGQVLGQVTPDDVLGRIFSTFCIGK
jgi:tRNA modification GTPase